MRLLQAQSLRLHLVVVAFELVQLELESLLNEPIHQAAQSCDFLGIGWWSHHKTSSLGVASEVDAPARMIKLNS
jgi:hypothetical protein